MVRKKVEEEGGGETRARKGQEETGGGREGRVG